MLKKNDNHGLMVSPNFLGKLRKVIYLKFAFLKIKKTTLN